MMPGDADDASLSARVDHGDDHDRGRDSDSTLSTSSSYRSDTFGAVNLAGEVVHRHRVRSNAWPVAESSSAPPVAVEGGITVENSRNVNIGPSTHIHVTVVKPAGPGPPAEDRGGRAAPADADPGDLGCLGGLGLRGAVHGAYGALGPAAFGAPPPKVPGVRRLLRWPCVAVPVMGCAALVTIAVVLIVLQEESSNGVETLANGVRLAKRSVWGALPPLEKPPFLRTPVGTVIIHHTGTDPCFYFEGCVERMQMMQNYHQGSAGKENWTDIGYNFVVGGDGVVYEGRGWDAVGAHLKHWNNITVGFALIGNFTSHLPPQAQTEMLLKLIAWGVEVGKIVKTGYRLAGACQLEATKSPGLDFMKVIESWPNYWDYRYNDSVACTE